MAAGQEGMSVGFDTVATLVNELMAGRDEYRLPDLHRQPGRLKRYVPSVNANRHGSTVAFRQ